MILTGTWFSEVIGVVHGRTIMHVGKGVVEVKSRTATRNTMKATRMLLRVLIASARKATRGATRELL